MKLRNLLLFALLAVCPLGWAEPTEVLTWTDPKKAAKERSDFLIQGEYTNKAHGLQIVSVEESQFYLSRYKGGLPGAGWDGSKIVHAWGDFNTATKWIEGFERIKRVALGKATPPEDAIILFDGSNANEWRNGEVHDGLLFAGTSSIRKFKDFTLHFEFRTSYKPDLPLGHPDRGNSGLYIFGRYEIQIMDTFGLDTDLDVWKENPLVTEPYAWCGSIYKVKAPRINMCFPPLAWQSYDITFRAPRFENGVKTENARVSVTHNGIEIHKDVELSNGTGNGGKLPEIESGSLNLQKHGNLTYFRNIWILEH